MKTQKLYKISLKIMKELNSKKKKLVCNNCFVYKIQRELEKEHFEFNFHNYHGSNCSNVLFYLEDLGIIKILQGVPGAEYDNLNRRYGVECGKLKIKVCNNPFKYNKI